MNYNKKHYGNKNNSDSSLSIHIDKKYDSIETKLDKILEFLKNKDTNEVTSEKGWELLNIKPFTGLPYTDDEFKKLLKYMYSTCLKKDKVVLEQVDILREKKLLEKELKDKKKEREKYTYTANPDYATLEKIDELIFDIKTIKKKLSHNNEKLKHFRNVGG